MNLKIVFLIGKIIDMLYNHIQNFIFAVIIVSILSIFNTNSVYYSILLLLFVFLEFFGIILILNFDFVAYTFMIIYSGAVVILFVLVMMLFEQNSPEYSISTISRLPISIILVNKSLFKLTLLFFYIYLIFSIYLLYDSSLLNNILLIEKRPMIAFFENSNIRNLGNSLFGLFFFELYLLGFVLLIVILTISIFFSNL